MTIRLFVMLMKYHSSVLSLALFCFNCLAAVPDNNVLLTFYLVLSISLKWSAEYVGTVCHLATLLFDCFIALV